jgi:SEC-C motif-containing protein
MVLFDNLPTGYQMTEKCYCKSGLDFSLCCQPILRVDTVPSSPLALMRSRYSAYCLGDVNYLQATTHDHTWSDEELKFIQDWADNSHWQHLDIVSYTQDTVEFKAYYIYKNKQHLHHEKSTFKKVNDMYKYVDGDIFEDSTNFSKNEKCICGSGLKYKRCCLKRI